MDYNGDVLMCSHDWGKKNILGNLKNEDFLDIWLNNKTQTARNRLSSADREFKPCNVCDVGTTISCIEPSKISFPTILTLVGIYYIFHMLVFIYD